MLAYNLLRILPAGYLTFNIRSLFSASLTTYVLVHTADVQGTRVYAASPMHLLSVGDPHIFM